MLKSLFDRIKIFVESGKNINQFYPNESVLYHFLSHYYQYDFWGTDCIDDTTEDVYAEELDLPLTQRPSGIFKQVEWMLAQGADVNAGGELLPLMPAVGSLDIAMTEYLLEHGANPHFDSDEDPRYGYGNYYIDKLDNIALDIDFANDAYKTDLHKITQIAALFAKRGVTDVKSFCISIDSKTRTVFVSEMKVIY